MELNFPNKSRSYDARRQLVRFWGYDRAMEVSFLIEVNALRRLAPRELDLEADILSAFDETREHICAVARIVYARRRTSVYRLAASDF